MRFSKYNSMVGSRLYCRGVNAVIFLFNNLLMKNKNSVHQWRIAFLVICAIGCCLSADLLRLHFKVHTDPEYHSYCAISEQVNCETVAASDYSVFARLPLAIWGLIGYLIMGVLAIWGLRKAIEPDSWPFGFLFWLNIFSSIVSIYLFVISHFIIKSLCIVCLGTYLVNFSLLGIAIVVLSRLRADPVKALQMETRFLATRKTSIGTVCLIFIAMILILWIIIPPYWRMRESIGPRGFPVGITEEGYPWIGANKPILVISEFSDYQCPYCRRGHDEMRKLIEAYPDRVRLVHRHYPLDNECNEVISRPFHPYACTYARIAYCAQQQGHFWETNDYLFKNGRRQESITLDEIASVIHLNVGLLRECLRNNEATKAIEHDLSTGRQLNIRGTPTYVIREQIYIGRLPPEIISSALQ